MSRLAQIDKPEVANVLLLGWQSHSPELRKLIIEAIVSRQAWSENLRGHVHDGIISVSELTAPIRQQLLADSKNAGLWNQLFEAKETTDRAEVLTRFKPAIKLDGNARRGHLLFKKLCINCHNVKDEGHHVGP